MTETEQPFMNNVISISDKVSRLIEPILSDLGYELVDVEYLSEHGRWILRIYADKDGGISLDDCASISKEIGDIIDVKNIIRHKYVLEVSSPGLQRPIKKEKHYLSAVGEKIKIRTNQPIEGRRNFTGRLQNVENGSVLLELAEKELRIGIQDIDKANVVFEFEN